MNTIAQDHLQAIKDLVEARRLLSWAICMAGTQGTAFKVEVEEFLYATDPRPTDRETEVKP